MEQQREDGGGVRLQCFKRGFEKGLVIWAYVGPIKLTKGLWHVSNILSLGNTKVTKPGLLSSKARGCGSCHLSSPFLKFLVIHSPFISAVTKHWLMSGPLHMLFLLPGMPTALVPASFSFTEAYLLWNADLDGSTPGKVLHSYMHIESCVVCMQAWAFPPSERTLLMLFPLTFRPQQGHCSAHIRTHN